MLSSTETFQAGQVGSQTLAIHYKSLVVPVQADGLPSFRALRLALEKQGFVAHEFDRRRVLPHPNVNHVAGLERQQHALEMFSQVRRRTLVLERELTFFCPIYRRRQLVSAQNPHLNCQTPRTVVRNFARLQRSKICLKLTV